MSSLHWFALTSIVATVLAVQGDRVEIDKGLIDGLRPGDRCQVFYTLTVGQRRVRIEAGSAEIIETDDFQALARPSKGAAIRPGYSIEVQASQERVSPETYLRLANTRLEAGNYTAALGYFRRMRELLPNDPLVNRKIEEVEALSRGDSRKDQERERLDYYRLAAQRSLEEGDLRSTRTYIDKILALEPGDEDAARLGERVLLLERTDGMIRVEGGEYEIGADLGQASYYNQQPRFRVRLKPFWIDRNPVGVDDLARADLAVGAGEAGAAASRVSFFEAAEYCRLRSKRLPTEFEWEVAASTSGLVGAPGISEWTASWYLPYPGNKSPEQEYGEKFRVVKGYRPNGEFDPLLRFFMAPPERAVDVGFRCAWDSDMSH